MRKEMVKKLIELRGVSDKKVLEAMTKVERHRFVSRQYQNDAYDDTPLPIGKNQTISQPYIVGYMTEILRIKSGDKVLEIGTGSGYQTAVLAEMAKQVYSVEILDSLAKSAVTLLKKLGYTNIEIKTGDGYRGWPEHAPFDDVIVTAAPERVPQPLVDQLAEGGRMIIPVGGFSQKLIFIQKKKGGIIKEEVLPVRFVPMTGEVEKRKY